MKSSKVRLKLAEVSSEDHAKHNFKNEWTKTIFISVVSDKTNTYLFFWTFI